MNLLKNMTISSTLLGLFAIVGTLMVAFTHHNTAARIAANERAFLLRSLHALVKPSQHDNDLFTDVIQVKHTHYLGTEDAVNVYRARMAGEPVAVIINSVAPDGYSGNISLLVAIQHDGKLAGVRVVNHRETPGLGDAIEASRSDWVLGFNGKSLLNPDKKDWAVKRDGGKFDQFTGATITPRAVVKAVYNTLQYYEEHQDRLFAPLAKQEPVS